MFYFCHTCYYLEMSPKINDRKVIYGLGVGWPTNETIMLLYVSDCKTRYYCQKVMQITLSTKALFPRAQKPRNIL